VWQSKSSKNKEAVFMWKRVAALGLAILLAAALLAVTGCGKKEAGAPQANQKVIELRLHHQDPPQSAMGQFFDAWAKEIGEKTKGKVKVTVYAGGSLGGQKESYNMVTSGICDIAWGFVGMFPGQFPMTEVISLPMLDVRDAKVGSKVLWDLYQNTDFLKKEYKDVKVLVLHTHMDVPLSTKEKKIQSAEDVKGLKIRTVGGPPTEFAKQMGMSPLNMPTSDVYEALNKGVIDGYLCDWHAIHSFKMVEQTKHILDVRTYVGPFWIVMNKAKWESLPDDVKKAVEEVSGFAAIEKIAVQYGKIRAGVEKTAADRGAIIYRLPDAEYQRWQNTSKSIWEKWVKDMTAKGYPAKDVLARTQELIKKYNGEK